MGRYLVILIATLATVWGLCMFFPGITAAAFHFHGTPIAWTALLCLPIGYVYHRFTS